MTKGFIMAKTLLWGILFHVYDQMGKRLLSQTVNATSFDLNCSDFPKGIYSIQLVWDDGVKVKQILIN